MCDAQKEVIEWNKDKRRSKHAFWVNLDLLEEEATQETIINA